MQVFSKSEVGDPCIEALMGFSHVSSPDVLNNTLLSQDWVLEVPKYTFQVLVEEGLETPPPVGLGCW